MGCLEVANKKGRFSTYDHSLVEMICKEIATGILLHEAKITVKKELYNESIQKYELLNTSYQ